MTSSEYTKYGVILPSITCIRDTGAESNITSFRLTFSSVKLLVKKR